MFVDPYKSTIVLKCIIIMYCQNYIFGVWTPFSVTNHSADINVILSHDLNQYVYGKKFPVAACYNKQNFFSPQLSNNSNMCRIRRQNPIPTHAKFINIVLTLLFNSNVTYFTLSYLRAVQHYT